MLMRGPCQLTVGCWLWGRECESHRLELLLLLFESTLGDLQVPLQLRQPPGLLLARGLQVLQLLRHRDR